MTIVACLWCVHVPVLVMAAVAQVVDKFFSKLDVFTVMALGALEGTCAFMVTEHALAFGPDLVFGMTEGDISLAGAYGDDGRDIES